MSRFARMIENFFYVNLHITMFYYYISVDVAVFLVFPHSIRLKFIISHFPLRSIEHTLLLLLLLFFYNIVYNLEFCPYQFRGVKYGLKFLHDTNWKNILK